MLNNFFANFFWIHERESVMISTCLHFPRYANKTVRLMTVSQNYHPFLILGAISLHVLLIFVGQPIASKNLHGLVILLLAERGNNVLKVMDLHWGFSP